MSFTNKGEKCNWTNKSGQQGATDLYSFVYKAIKENCYLRGCFQANKAQVKIKESRRLFG